MNSTDRFFLVAESEAAKTAAKLFQAEIIRRFPFIKIGEGGVKITFCETETGTDDYRIEDKDDELIFSSSGLRGFIFCIGRFFRKTQPEGNRIVSVINLSCDFSPVKKVRGHQLGYRGLNNTYDMWSIEDYSRYYLDMMYFGANTVEHIPYEKGVSGKKPFMKYDELELLRLASAEAAKYGLDVSLWWPNSEKDLASALENRRKVLSEIPDIDYVFPPGADPGDLPVPELFEWLKAINAEMKKTHPHAKLTPSAQMPHNAPDWGEQFISEMEKNPDYIDQVVQGPNRAFTTDELRRRLPKRYPIRFYPDITHNVRSETPVHFDADDWHYGWTTPLSRECINPRPEEYKRFHYLQAPYTIGSVTYSEGVNDDVNKMVWCALEYDPTLQVTEILEDYARAFMPGADAEKIRDAILGLENNWLTSPQNASGTDYTLGLWIAELDRNPSMLDNWRFVSGLFRATCDAYIRSKVLSEEKVVAKALCELRLGNIGKALSILESHSNPVEDSLLVKIEEYAEILYKLIGIQLSVEKYNADGVERGATLDTITLPVTDLEYLKNICRKAIGMEDASAFIDEVVNHTSVKNGEWYFSFALHGLSYLGERQTPDYYMDYQGDRPEVNDGTLPMCCTKLFDHFMLRARLGGLAVDKDYLLIITYRNSPNADTKQHRVAVNNHIIYEGPQFGGRKNETVSAVLPDRFIAVEYDVPAGYIENGCIYLEISEPTSGFETAEIRFKEKT